MWPERALTRRFLLSVRHSQLCCTAANRSRRSVKVPIQVTLTRCRCLPLCDTCLPGVSRAHGRGVMNFGNVSRGRGARDPNVEGDEPLSTCRNVEDNRLEASPLASVATPRQ